MRNLKKVLCLALVLSMVLAVVSGAAYYRDYADADDMNMLNEEYLIAAQLFNDLDIVVGVPTADEGVYEYQPNEKLTRAEMARILYVLYSGIGVSDTLNVNTVYESLPCTFTDISDTWAVKEIKYGYTMGYLSGRNASTFAPNDYVSAQEFATALLAVIGYKKADLADNWPKNVIIYGAEDANANLFTTGLKEGAFDVTSVGEQIIGISTGTVADTDTQSELTLSGDITREQAIYMMYKAVVKKNMYGSSTNFLAAKWGVEVVKTPSAGYVYASESAGYYDTDYTGAAELVTFEDTIGGAQHTYVDLGVSYDDFYNQSGSATGFEVGYEDWNANIGKYVTFTIVTFLKDGAQVGDTYINGYDIDFDTLTRNGMTDAAEITTVSVPTNTAVSFDGTAITIAGTEYTLFRDSALVYVNGVKNVMTDIAEVAAEIGNGAAVGTDGMTADELTLTVVNGSEISVAKEIEMAMYTIADIYDSPTILSWGYSGYKDVELTNGMIFNVLGVAHPQFSITGNFQVGSTLRGYIKGSKLVASVVEPTKIEKANVVVENGVAYINSVAEENKINIAYCRAAGTDSNTALTPATDVEFVANSGKYYDFTIIDGVVYDCAEIDKVKTVTAGTIVSNTRVVNTVDNKAIFTIVAADENGTEFTFSYNVTVGSAEDTTYSAMEVDDTVSFKYDVKTLKASDLAE